MSNATLGAPNLGAVTTQEAAWIAGVSAKTINAAIDRGEVRPVARPRRRGVTSRQIGAAEVVYFVVRKEAGAALSAQARRELYAQLTAQRWGDWTIAPDIAEAASTWNREITLAGGVVRIAIQRACTAVARRWAGLRSATDLVVEDPEIRGGEPVLRGTRVPVHLVADLVGQGADVGEVLEDYPALTAAMVEAALAYAATHPRRGRPAKGPWRAGREATPRPRR